ncbi:hypothetical protein GPY61_30110 [Massilia sp. NEAU-DD11]|uniref:Uncharacterized protein n=1 Tax=Massilia cellulosiltytica TaxID=2683234 RepID=A0A7X3G5S6_9BURK|nr:hypothetical protein [Telluria cellulosilytica]MVW64192.1 hypothetical protein [Telluria cellulosilytica]
MSMGIRRRRALSIQPDIAPATKRWGLRMLVPLGGHRQMISACAPMRRVWLGGTWLRRARAGAASRPANARRLRHLGPAPPFQRVHVVRERRGRIDAGMRAQARTNDRHRLFDLIMTATMNDDIDHKTQRLNANVQPLHSRNHVRPPASYADLVERRILENHELVQRVLDSEKNISAPVTVEEFKTWLVRLGDE